MDFTISIDDTLVPGIIAIATLEGRHPADVVQGYAYAAANKACQDLKVGPYYEGPIPPQFNADGTPYVAPAADAEPATEDQDTAIAVEGEE